ncbi:MAG: exo-alpha-sialidase, partial [Armatimonadetes bacterium]|nr:exo-alpha-sialidase [Armatimonadota bacterium]
MSSRASGSSLLSRSPVSRWFRAGAGIGVLLMTAVSGAEPGPIGERFDAVPAVAPVVRNSEGSILERKDGSLLMIYQEFEQGAGDSDFFPGRLVARESRDGGRTWLGRRVVVEREAGDINVFSPSLLRLPNGEILFCFMRYHPAEAGRLPPASAFAWLSRDDGATFTPLATLWKNRSITLCSATLRRTSRGRILLPINRDSSRPGERDHWQAGLCWSDDNGRTWNIGDHWVDAAMRGAMEPQVEETREGRLLMVMRTQLGAIYQSESRDQGATWSPSTSLGVEAPESCPELIRIPATGDLLLVWNAARYDRNWASHFGKRTPLSLAVSRDEGKTWSPPLAVESDPGAAFSNPGAAFTRNGTLVLNYWTCRYEPSGRMTNFPIHLKTAVVPLERLYPPSVPEYR